MNKQTNFRTLLILALVVLLGSNQNIAQNVGIGAESFTPDPSAMLEVKSNDKGFLPPRVELTGTANASPLSAHIQGMIVYNTATAGDVTPGLYLNDGTKWTALGASGGGSPERYIGEEYLGGIIYYLYLDANGVQRGLIVSKTETAAQWQSTNSATGANRTWDGAFNTNLMTNSPARTWIDNNFNTGGLNAGAGVWYLPSLDQLRRIHDNRDFINLWLNNSGGTLLTTAYYWSSTESTANNARYFDFTNGSAYNDSKDNTYRVRAVRAF